MRPFRSILRSVLNRAGVDVVRGQGLYCHHHQLLRMLVERLGVDCVVDVGGHKGEFGRYLRNTVGYGGRIVSFEPVATTFAELSKMAERDAKWAAHNHGLGSRSEQRIIHVMQSTDYSSVLPARSIERLKRAMSVTQEQEIRLETLDSLSNDVVPADAKLFLKTDTQGFDLEVLLGGKRFLPRVSLLQMELAIKPIYEGVPPYGEVLDYVREHGFAVAGLFPITRDTNFSVIEFDCVLVNEDKHSGAIRLGPVFPPES